jgi:hypothetical protein
LGCTRAFRLLICSEPGARYVISSGRLAGTAAMRGFFDMCVIEAERQGAVEGTKKTLDPAATENGERLRGCRSTGTGPG